MIQRLIATRSPSVPSPGRPRRRPDSPSHAHSLHGALRVLRGAWERTRFHSARVAPAAVPWVQVPASAMGPLESFSTPHFFSLLFFYVSVYCFYFFVNVFLVSVSCFYFYLLLFFRVCFLFLFLFCYCFYSCLSCFLFFVLFFFCLCFLYLFHYYYIISCLCFTASSLMFNLGPYRERGLFGVFYPIFFPLSPL